MSKLLYKVINPIVKTLLKSPLHRTLSSNTLLLEFVGRKSGRPLSTPISYHIQDGAAHCFTAKEYGWWRNLTAERPVTLTIRGEVYRSIPRVEFKNREQMQSALRDFLIAVPRDAPHSGVKLDQNGVPIDADIQQAVPGMVYLQFPLEQVNDKAI